MQSIFECLLIGARRVLFGLVVLAAGAATVGCGGCHSDPPPDPRPAPPMPSLGPGPAPVVNTSVGVSGAALASADGKLQLTVPANALTAVRTITAAPIGTNVPPAPVFVAGTGYAFGPGGLGFAVPAQLTVRYDPAQLPAGFDESHLALAKIRDDGVLELAGNIQVDTTAKTVRGDISGFSSWGVITACNGLVAAIPDITVQSTTPSSVSLLIGPYTTAGSATNCQPTRYLVERAPATVTDPTVPGGVREPLDGEYLLTNGEVPRVFVGPNVLYTYPFTDSASPNRPLLPGTGYRYRLRKEVTIGANRLTVLYPPGQSVIATTLTLPGNVMNAPPVPDHFVAAPDYAHQGPYNVIGDGKRIRLNWSPVEQADHYRLEKQDSSGQFVALANVVGTTNFYDTDVAPAAIQRFVYRLTAVNGAGDSTSVTASAKTETSVAVHTFCFDSNSDYRCDFGETLSHKVEAGRQFSVPFRITPPILPVPVITSPPVIGECEIYFALFDAANGIGQPANQGFSSNPLRTGPGLPLDGSNHLVNMTVDVAADATLGIHHLTLYATGCFGPIVLKQPIALDVRPPGLPYLLTVLLQGPGTVTSGAAGIDCGIDCKEYYAANASVDLSANPAPGSTFAGWSGDCSGMVSPHGLGMDADKTCTATFTLPVTSTTNAHMAAGHFYSFARKSGGAVESWGIDSSEELGNGPGNGARNTPGPIAAISDVIALATLYGGNGNGFVVRANREVWGWGNNAFGQLGDATMTTVRATPVVMTDASGASVTNAAAVAAGAGHTLVLLANGNVLAVGRNDVGQLGNGGISAPRSQAAAVAGLTAVRAIAAGAHFSVALRTDGTVWTWGANNRGQLGDAASGNRSAPARVAGLANIVAISAGAEYAVALDSSGDVWAWGTNGNGELGDASGFASRAMPGRIALAGVTAVAAGLNHAFAIKTGVLYGWGLNQAAQLGLGDNVSRSAPVAIGGIGSVTEVVGGSTHSLAVDSNSDVWAWGSNGSGELGLGSGQLQVPTPQRIPGLNVN